MKELLGTLIARRDLTVAQAEALLRGLIDPEEPAARKGALLGALATKGETAAEIEGLARAMRGAARTLPGELPAVRIDTCGTGGDGSSTINISTAAALVLAADGLAVVKHGNRSVSSKSGSADVLEAMGIALPAEPEVAAERLRNTGFAFLFAPTFHPATAAVVPVRRALGVRTAFNILGPLTNPARPTHQLIGAYAPDVAEKMARALAGMGGARALVVHGAPAWDEATPVGDFAVWSVCDGQVEHSVRSPESYGLDRCSPADLEGGSAAVNAEFLTRLLCGELMGPMRDAVLLNVALCYEILGECDGKEAIARGASVLDSGRGKDLLARLQ